MGKSKEMDRSSTSASPEFLADITKVLLLDGELGFNHGVP